MNQAVQQLSSMPASDLHNEILRRNRLCNNSKWEFCVSLRAADVRKLHIEYGCSSMFEYANRFLNIDARLTSELLRVIRKLDVLPGIAAAFESGQLSWSKVKEVSRVATSEDERAWLSIALNSTCRQLDDRIAVSAEQFRNNYAAKWQQATKNANSGGSQPGTAATHANDNNNQIGASKSATQPTLFDEIPTAAKSTGAIDCGAAVL